MSDSPRALVVGYDGSEPARAAVRYAGRRLGAEGRLYVVHATGPLATWLSAAEELLVDRDRAANGRAVLDELALEADGVLIDTDYELVLVPGSPADALVQEAFRHSADEIVVGAHGAGRLEALLGSTTRRVLEAAGRPVVVVPSS